MEKVLFFLALVLGVNCIERCSKEGQKVQVPGRCSYYKICRNGTYNLDKCPLGQKYNSTSQTCQWYWNVICQDWAPECEDGLLYRHPDSCRAYYSCSESRLKTEFCPFLFGFNGAKCTFMTTCPEAECQKGETRAADCSNYDSCENGKWTRKTCGFGQSFDADEKKCKYGGCSQCEHGTTKLIDGYCHKYKECKNGLYEEKTCGIGMMYNVTTGLCDWFYKVDCSPVKKMCTGNYSFCGDKDCKTYYKCENDVLKIEKCGLFRQYDLNVNKCVYRFNSFASLNSECIENTLVPNQDCLKYDKCVNGVMKTFSCPKYQAFDAQSKMCLFEDETVCSQDSCIDGRLYRIKSDCYSYYECSKGQKIKKSCGLLHYFDPETLQCTFSVLTKDCSSLLCEDRDTRATKNKFIYEKCVNGEWVKQECIPGYDSYRNRCPECTSGLREKANNRIEYKDCIGGWWVYDYCKNDGEIYDEITRTCVKSRSRRETCTIGEKKFIPGYCSMYNFCSKNGWDVRTCPKGTNFQDGQCLATAICPVYEPVQDQCDVFKYKGETYKCDPGDKFDYIKKQCVPYALGHCYEKECENNTRKNHGTDCGKYYECSDNKYVVKECGYKQNFDSISQKCVFWGAKCAYENETCNLGYKRGADCKSYEVCKGDYFEKESCWFFQRFNANKQTCDWYWNVDCNYAELYASIYAETCVENEKIHLDNTCRYYKQCINNVWTVQKCSPCMNFNSEIKDCDYVWRKPCDKGITDPTGITTDATPTTPTTPKPEKCVDGDVRGDKDSCSVYQVCVNNSWDVEKCSFWQRFDSVTKTCVFYTSATCTQ